MIRAVSLCLSGLVCALVSLCPAEGFISGGRGAFSPSSPLLQRRRHTPAARSEVEMAVSAGIVGLPNVGKSTLFSAVTKKQVDAQNYPFCTIEPNTGIVEVRDRRLDKLGEINASQKIVHATTEFTDIAGLVKGASKGEGLGNKFLDNIRGTDLICHVVRCFLDDDVIHVDGQPDPRRDAAVINEELVLADLQMATNALENLKKQSAHKLKNDKDGAAKLELLESAVAHLGEKFLPLRSLGLSDKAKGAMKYYNFITSKPQMYIANVSEDDLPDMDNDLVKELRAVATEEGADVVPICAKFEAELAGLEEEEALEFMQEGGIEEPGLDRLIRTTFDRLGLMTFLTTGKVESRAWTIPKNCAAPQAAATIHTDLEKGFIRAEVLNYEDLMTFGGVRTKAKEAGKVRMEGKDYVMQEGDIVIFHTST
uniref:Obg-like ATPase 1 n=1 Tax=Chromera velia CCMP2878 TaxID=1169474 RepID=A0A0G4GSZ1_9ALVE|eukprot:Cvel_23234.t1-p1 / transcript=Cvel_23234.t1 / gene=Cvel_23234 / organism=Chromera_velia_CCMP2878 / gene_product=Ribosome-binding ATPase YchF, putative / transcript_product=Ribosome-binding ATPase YchF, putative / location=Cvel_scaffold2372:2736-8418(-) / protein_length=424 / sequence_SO=supercontig / SO=protein_coding / is_pseudo=false